jgi:hypothetical protein
LAKSREERNGIGDANTLGVLARNAIVPQQDDFFYTYVTNRSIGKVSFDNMKISRWAPNVRANYVMKRIDVAQRFVTSIYEGAIGT